MEVPMSKKPGSKLTLKRDTLRRLDPAQLDHVRGGGGGVPAPLPSTSTCRHIISVLIGL